MKALSLSASPRRSGNCELLTAHSLKAIAEEGIETELVTLAGLDIRPCTACGACSGNETCSIKDDLWPVYENEGRRYYLDCRARLHGLARRARQMFHRSGGYIDRNNKRVFTDKVGGPIVVARRGGARLHYRPDVFLVRALRFRHAESTTGQWRSGIKRATS